MNLAAKLSRSLSLSFWLQRFALFLASSRTVRAINSIALMQFLD